MIRPRGWISSAILIVGIGWAVNAVVTAISYLVFVLTVAAISLAGIALVALIGTLTVAYAFPRSRNPILATKDRALALITGQGRR